MTNRIITHHLGMLGIKTGQFISFTSVFLC